MMPSTRAFLVLSLAALCGATVLHLLALIGVAGMWSAIVHLVLFGWVTGMIVTITYHTTPVFSGRNFPYPILAWLHLVTLITGLALAVSGLLLFSYPVILGGLSLEIGAALLFTANIVSLFARGTPRPGRPPAPPVANQSQVDKLGTHATRNAGIFLPLALALVAGHFAGWLRYEWVLAGEHLAALGWIMLTVVGVAYHMLPRFNGRAVRGVSWVRAQLVSHHLALLLMVPALGMGWELVFAIGGLIMTVALGLFGWTVWPALSPQRMAATAIPLVLKERQP